MSLLADIRSRQSALSRTVVFTFRSPNYRGCRCSLYTASGHNPSSVLPRPPWSASPWPASVPFPLCAGDTGDTCQAASGLQRTVAEMTDRKTHSGFTIPVTSKVSAGPVCHVHSQACPLTSESGTWTGWGWVLVCGTQFFAICQCSRTPALYRCKK